MKKIAVGILAHVDAGKTTLSEGLLYSAGALDSLGRVDKKDAFFDTHSLERERGITIFSKQAIFGFANTEITLIDTPGHIDFSTEAERALSVQDYAILVISATDGVTSHTKTLWHLIASRKIPTFIFVNKTDISDRRREDIMKELSLTLSDGCVDFSLDTSESFYESVASRDERLMEEFFETDSLSEDSIRGAVSRRRVFPCYFGSALKMKGVSEFLVALDKYTEAKKYSDTLFGAKVYKIARDKQGKRLTYLKITGGSLKTKDSLPIKQKYGDTVYEKVEEIRLYSGEKYKSVAVADAGTVCAVLGPASTRAGEGIGIEGSFEQTLCPVLDYRVILPKDVSAYETYMRLTALAEEDPSLALSYEPSTHEIRVRLMGEIQLEVLTRVISERFGLDVKFDEGAILYKETVADTVFGAGHFEPLRHYSEVHLRIDPLPEGSGVISATECPVDTLALNWQRLVLTHIEERVHRGVLTGSPLTDVKITLTAGKAHLKHTEGGDFRQATYRAVRQGLMKAENLLLEPTFDFRMELPTEYLGRAMNDITNMHGVSEPPEIFENMAVLTGNCPVVTMRSYATELRAYTRGEGKLSLTVGPYVPCHNTAEVVEKMGYDPSLDERNTPNSVFCKAGAGYAVMWYEADSMMHITPTGMPKDRAELQEVLVLKEKKRTTDYRSAEAEDKELMRIFESTYGKIKKRTVSEKTENSSSSEKKQERPKKQRPPKKTYIIIDGYNFVFANESLRKLSEKDISVARDAITRMMCDYTSFHECKAIIVFDAYKRRGGEGSVIECGNVKVVYTKETETADSFIERITHDMADEYTVRVVTSDLQEQLMVLGSGGLRVSAVEFYKELCDTARLIRETIDTYLTKC